MALADQQPENVEQSTSPSLILGPTGTSSQAQPATQVVYVLDNPAMPGYVKIGRTNDLPRRMGDLFNTSVPAPFNCFYAARVENADRVETQLFEIFGDKRSHPKREFFEVEPHRVAAAIKLVAIEDVTASVATDSSTNQEDTASLARAITRAEKYNFEMLNIPVDAELQSVKDPSIVCKVVSQRPPKVDFRGAELSLSRAAQEVMNSSYGLQGSKYWEYEGETLEERRTRMENAESDDK